MRYLVEGGKADVDIAARDDGTTPLFVAASNGHTEVVRVLVEEGKADVDKATSDDGATPLLIAAQNAHMEVVQLLVKEGNADVDKAASDDGSTPLCAAAANGHAEIVRLLVEEGKADVDKVNNKGRTPLFQAATWPQGSVGCSSEGQGGQVHRDARWLHGPFDRKSLSPHGVVALLQ